MKGFKNMNKKHTIKKALKSAAALAMALTLLLALVPAITTPAPAKAAPAYVSVNGYDNFIVLADGTEIELDFSDYVSASSPGNDLSELCRTDVRTYSDSGTYSFTNGAVESDDIAGLVIGSAPNITAVGDYFLANLFLNRQDLTSITALDLSGLNNLTTVGDNFAFYMFSGCYALVSLPSGFNIPQSITTIGDGFCNSMFYGDYNLLSLPDRFNLPQYITSPGNEFAYSMFAACYALRKLPNGFNLPQAITGAVGYSFARDMFFSCEALSELPQGFTFPQGITSCGEYFAYEMFSGNNEMDRSQLSSLPSGFNLPQNIVTVESWFAFGMFADTMLTSLPVGFNFPQGITGDTGIYFAGQMFIHCRELSSLPAGFNFPQNITGYMFAQATFNDTALEEGDDITITFPLEGIGTFAYTSVTHDTDGAELVSGYVEAGKSVSLKGAVYDPSIMPEKGDLYIHKYLVGDASLAGGIGDGTENVTLPGDATPLDGIIFKIYKISVPNAGNVPYQLGNTTSWSLDDYEDPEKLTVEGDEYDLTPADTASVTTNKNGLGLAENLPKGIYLVVEQTDSRVTSPAQPFVVAVPMTNPTGDGWLTKVHVYPKNEQITATKEADKTVVKIGDKIGWTITIPLPADIADYTKFVVTDELDESLEYYSKWTSISTQSKSGSYNRLNSSTYTITPPSDGNNNTFTFELNGFGDAVSDLKYIYITFYTTVNDKILDKTDNSVANQAKIEFTNKYGEEKEVLTTTPTVHTGTVSIQKVDANSNKGKPDQYNSLSVNGAVFKIALSEAEAKGGVFIRKDENGIYFPGDTGYDNAQDWEVEVTGATWQKAGQAVFAGLPNYTEENVVNTGGTETSDRTYYTYYIVETKAPNGYNLLGSAVAVSFDENNSNDTTVYTAEITVKNTTAFTLPKTGGAGTVMFTAGGIVLIGAAVVIAIVAGGKKRKSNVKFINH